MFIIFERNVYICKKIEYLELRKFNGKLYTLYIYMKCLDLQKNWISITTKIPQEIIYIIYVRNFWICRKIEYLELGKFNRKLCTLYVRNVWICKKIERPKLHKFNRKLCTLYVRNVWIWRKIDVQSCGNSIENCVHYTCGMFGFAEKLNVQTTEIQREIMHIIRTEFLDLHKNWVFRTA